MTSTRLRGFTGLAALTFAAAAAADASAFCGTCGGGSVAYYQPAAYQAAYTPYQVAYAPATAYTTYYGSSSSWWPGCCLGRLFGWGSPSTYAVSYAPTYAVSYAPATSSCSTCAPCTTCAPQVTMRPVCATACSPCVSCADCSSCPTTTVGQAVYQQPGCATCGNGVTVVAPPQGGTTVIQGGAVPSGPSPTPANGAVEQRPGLGAGETPPAERQTFETQRPGDANGGVQPGPADDTSPNGTSPNNGGSDPLNDVLNGDPNANYFEAPQLFNPNDRAASRIAVPVYNAIYEKPVNYQRVSSGPITAAQAQADAAGWTSASE